MSHKKICSFIGWVELAFAMLVMLTALYNIIMFILQSMGIKESYYASGAVFFWILILVAGIAILLIGNGMLKTIKWAKTTNIILMPFIFIVSLWILFVRFITAGVGNVGFVPLMDIPPIMGLIIGVSDILLLITKNKTT